MKQIDLIEFITEARLCSIKVGSTKSQVKRVIGKPAQYKKYTSEKENNSWLYNDLRIEFDKSTNLVTSIGFFCKVPRFPSIGKTIIETHNIKFGMQVEDFELLMKDANHKESKMFQNVKYQSDYYGWELEYKSGVALYFSGESDGVAPLVEIATRNT